MCVFIYSCARQICLQIIFLIIALVLAISAGCRLSSVCQMIRLQPPVNDQSKFHPWQLVTLVNVAWPCSSFKKKIFCKNAVYCLLAALSEI
jgi:hypothetical protein